jgi:hypothetical protein
MANENTCEIEEMPAWKSDTKRDELYVVFNGTRTRLRSFMSNQNPRRISLFSASRAKGLSGSLPRSG